VNAPSIATEQDRGAGAPGLVMIGAIVLAKRVMNLQSADGKLQIGSGIESVWLNFAIALHSALCTLHSELQTS
jgi:hypothetical protein